MLTNTVRGTLELCNKTNRATNGSILKEIELVKAHRPVNVWEQQRKIDGANNAAG